LSNKCVCVLLQTTQTWNRVKQICQVKKVNLLGVVVGNNMIKNNNNNNIPFDELKGVVITSSIEKLCKSLRFNANTPHPKPLLCMVAGHSLYQSCLDKIPSTALLIDPPGNLETNQLRQMLKQTHKQKVYVSFPKHTATYVKDAISLSRQIPNGHVFFCHNNSNETADLEQVFNHHPEGMLKSMAIHELALLVSFFGVTVESIAKFKVNTGKLFSELLEFGGRTDFARFAFKITTTTNRSVSVMCDTCGGSVSFAVVKDVNGLEVRKFETNLNEWENQQIDFLNCLVENMLDSKNDQTALPTLETALEAQRLAEYCTEKLQAALNAA